MQRFCPKYSRILEAQDNERGRRLLTRSRCKMWNCTYCARQNTKKIRKVLKLVIEGKRQWKWYFATLTARGGIRTAHGSYTKLKRAIPLIVRALKHEIARSQQVKPPRKYKRDARAVRFVHNGGGLFGVEYFAIFERHKDGVFHIHLFVGIECGYIEISRIKDKISPRTDFDLYLSLIAFKSGIGFKTHAVEIKTGNILDVVKYVTKSTRYLMKDSSATTLFLPPHGRLYQQSAAFSQLKLDKSDKEWRVRPRLRIEDILGEKWYDINLSESITSDSIDEYGAYPPLSEWLTD